MSSFRYFADVKGETIELSRVWFNYQLPAGQRRRGYSPEGIEMHVSRIIEYKNQPSKHKCDARCLHATGKHMKCECSCGGKNHGKGNASV